MKLHSLDCQCPQCRALRLLQAVLNHVAPLLAMYEKAEQKRTGIDCGEHLVIAEIRRYLEEQK